MTIKNSLNPIIESVQKQYIRHRKKGRTRAEAIELIRTEYAQELHDEDDRPAVLIGLSLSLCKKKELFEAIAVETLDEIRRINCDNMRQKVNDIDYVEIKRHLEDKAMYGEEALYKRTSIYVPDWKNGDTFSHVLTYPTSESLGIKGWFILLYKVGEYVDEFDVHHQLVYVSLCPPDKIPSCNKDFEKLEFLRVMCMGDRAEYLAQIMIKSKKAEEAYELSKVGCFPNVLLPHDHVEENPLTAMPLLGRMRKDDSWPGYEDQICRIYKKYGIRTKTSK